MQPDDLEAACVNCEQLAQADDRILELVYQARNLIRIKYPEFYPPPPPVKVEDLKLRKPKPDVKMAAVIQAKASGYTGDACSHCGSFRVVRSGTCSTCHDCQRTSGCS